jgi:hypothetical protein
MTPLASLLASAHQPDSENNLSSKDVTTWLADYLSAWEEELVRFPGERDQPHWDLLLADYDPDDTGMFVVALFRGASVTLAVGRGVPQAVRQFAESGFPKDPSDIITAAGQRFQVFESASFEIAELVNHNK